MNDTTRALGRPAILAAALSIVLFACGGAGETGGVGGETGSPPVESPALPTATADVEPSPSPTDASPSPTDASPSPTSAGASPTAAGASPDIALVCDPGSDIYLPRLADDIALAAGVSPSPDGASPSPDGASPVPDGASPAPIDLRIAEAVLVLEALGDLRPELADAADQAAVALGGIGAEMDSQQVQQAVDALRTLADEAC